MTIDNSVQTQLLCALTSDPEFFKENVHNLHLSDFPSLAVRLVFETVRAHFNRYNSLPTPRVLPDEVLNALRGIGPDGKDSIVTTVPETLVRSVANCLGQVITAISHPDPNSTAYFRDRWQEYLASVRIESLNGRGMSSKEQLEEAVRLYDEITRISGGDKKSVSTSAKKRVITKREAKKKRFGTGVWPIDIRMKMGMELGELGCCVAATGLGKTNLLVNFAVNMAMLGKHVLFISLEVSEEVILKRIHAMFGSFKMSLMDKPEEEWPPTELARYNYMLSDEFKALDNLEVNTEFTTRSATCSDVAMEIKKWKKAMKEKGISDDDCPLVCIDYIRQMDWNGVAAKSDNTNTQYGNIARALKQMALDNKCVIWTAQQATRQALKKSHLSTEDIADSVAIAHHCDVILGLTLVGIDPRTNQEISTWGSDSPTTEESEDDTADNHSDKERLINVDFCKLRNSGEKGTFCTVFQGKSLRLWTSSKYADQVEGNMSGITFEQFFAASKPKTV